MFASRVAVRAKPSENSGGARCRHDRPGLLRDHHSRRVLHPQVDTTKEDRHGAVPLVGVGLGDASDCTDDPRIVEHHVETPEGLHGLVDCASYRGLVRDVGVDESGDVTQASCERASWFVLDVGDDDTCSFFDEAQYRSLADATGSSGDDCDLSCQT